MDTEIKDILLAIKSGKLKRNDDETGSGGFWDLAGECQNLDNYDEETQEVIYNAFWEIVEILKDIEKK